DLFERLGHRDVLGQGVGPHLHPAAADVRGELDELPAALDILLDHGRVGRMKLTDGAATPAIDARVGEAFADLLALRLAHGRLGGVLVRGAQLDGGQADVAANLEDGRQVPVRSDVVGDDAEAKT